MTAIEVRVENQLKCEVCGRWIENTAGGNFATCPRQCGKLKRKLNRKEVRYIEEVALISKIPKAKKVNKKGKYEIDGRMYMVVKRMRFTYASNNQVERGCILAYSAEDKKPFLWLRPLMEWVK